MPRARQASVRAVPAAVLALGLLGALVPGQVAPAAAHPADDHAAAEVPAQGPCGPEPATALVAGRVECLHQDEPGDLPLPPVGDGGVAAAEAPSPAGPPCVGDGTSGHRVRAIYARPADRPDRYAEVVDEIRAHAAEISATFRESAARTAGEREVRWLVPGCEVDEQTGTSSGGELLVDHVVLSAAADDSAVAMRAELRALGYSSDLRKYLVWMDSDVLCGAGFIFNDDRADPAENNNAVFSTMGRVDSGLGATGQLGGPQSRCWGFAEAHELGHLLGAVQAPYVDQQGTPHAGAPHATAGFHCTDEWDLMCGDDDGGATPVAVDYVCGDPPSVLDGDRSGDRLLDCGNDDYFHTDPLEGSYLAEHWNVADSPYLEGGWEPPEATPLDPPANDAFVDATTVTGYRTTTDASSAGAGREEGEPAHGQQAADGSVWFRWAPPTDGLVQVTTAPATPTPYSGPLRPTVAVYEGGQLDELVPVTNLAPADGAGHQTTVTFDVHPGTTYSIAVDDWDLRGAPFRLVTGPPPNAFPDVGPADDAAIDWFTAVGITTGYVDGTFQPANQLNRQQLAAFLYRLAGRPPFTPPAALTFRDVRRTHAFHAEIEWLATQGITTGYPDGTFRSNTTLNRQQVAAFLYRTAGATSTATNEPFEDVSPTHAFRKEITWAWAQGLLDPTSATTFSSNQPVTRAGLADALHRLAGSPGAWQRPAPPTVWFTPPP